MLNNTSYVSFQIIIPMSGFGERFRRRGYTLPKPLIEVEGRPIIAHVLDMFPKENNVVLIANREHLDNDRYDMERTIQKHHPHARIEAIAPHKQGPVHAIRQIESLLDPDAPTVVNYCDFNCYWDWHHFKQFVTQSPWAGVIPAYKGFHPHSLGHTHYAYLLESKGRIQGIREKQPWTDNRMDEYASSGTYYFANGRLMLDAFDSTVKNGHQVAGEYYVSLAYRHLFANDLPVAVYPIQHFMQWGTPEDLEEYNHHSRLFKNLVKTTKPEKTTNGISIIPMAGMGRRFAEQGHPDPKPLIPVSGRPMALQALNDLPPTRHHVVVLRKDMIGHPTIVEELKHSRPGTLVETLPEATQGQACTALSGLEAFEKAVSENPLPVTIGACDNGVLYNSAIFRTLVHNPEVDVIVWGVRGHIHAIRHPHMFGWVEEKGGVISSVSVKEPLKSPESDPIVIGTFTFLNSKNFASCVKNLMKRNGRVNGEFTIDSCINDAIAMGLNCRLFEVEVFLCWGTPDELRTFQYWQSCFHKWKGHPYRLEEDTRIPPEKVAELKKSCYQWP